VPELPEVQTTVNGINRRVRGLKIIDVWTDYDSAFHARKNNIKNKDYFRKVFRPNVLGNKILNAKRRAKNILINISGNHTVLIHLKMTGHLLFGKYRKITDNKPFGKLRASNTTNKNRKEKWETMEKGPLRDPYNQYIHLVFTLSNRKHLVLSDVRKFAKVLLLKTSEIADSPDVKTIGPEPLDNKFSKNVIESRLMKKPRAKIKTALMDQALIAGIGNIYSDEILWLAGVGPERKVELVKDTEWDKIYKATKTILKAGIKMGGDSLSDYRNLEGKKGSYQNFHKAYQQTGKTCSKRDCRGIIKRIRIGGRSGHFCPKHQK